MSPEDGSQCWEELFRFSVVPPSPVARDQGRQQCWPELTVCAHSVAEAICMGLCNGKDRFLDTCLVVTAGASSRGQVHGSCGGPSGWCTLLLQPTHPLAVCTVLEVPKCSDYPWAYTEQRGSAGVVQAGIWHSCSHRDLNWLRVWFLGSGKDGGALGSCVLHSHGHRGLGEQLVQILGSGRDEVEAA